MSRAPRIPNAQWEKHKPTIRNLYISQEKKLEDVIQLMADDHGFQPTKAQYVRKLESWGFKKNSSKEKWEHAAAVVRKRKAEGKETELQMNGKVISTKKLRKEFGRYAYMPSFSRVPPIEPGGDLEGVVARTPPSSLSSGFIMPNYLPWFQFQDYLASILIPRSPPVSNPGWQAGADVNIPLGEDYREFWGISEYYGVPESPLQVAARSGNQDLVQALIEEGGNVNAKPTAFFGVTCLQAAASSGNENVVRMFLEHGAETNAPASDRGKMALPAAVSRGHIGVTEMLLEAGAFVNQIEGGLTPLCLAISRQSHELFELLMKYDADPDPPGVRYTPLGMAVAKEDLEMVSILLMAGADPNRSSSHDFLSGAELPLVTALHINAPGCSGRTVLQLAVERDNIHIVQELISQGADINAPAYPTRGRTALQLAVERDNIHIARKLISCGADVNAPPASEAGATAFQFAAMKGNIEMAILLLENQADINAERAPVEGRTALEGAAEHGRLDMVYLLVENDQDLETIEERCQDAARLAEKEEHFEIARILREWRRP
ncbi:hypothetical protein BHE90_001985 [Fusarium euwallaceae]|uniref:Clr5 domain-containing protein n=1 Tax=Fusarium euwallaceae TaxID=1147111 RepID=A0A430M6B9_9HYPO|nr:hypothetical protein BHE90_001985 [Fusarium euwallaceae]